jgi:GTP-binding protein HflX
VNGILEDLSLTEIPRLIVFNKMDRVDPEAIENLCRTHNAMAVSALQPASLVPLVERMRDFVTMKPRPEELAAVEEEPVAG